LIINNKVNTNDKTIIIYKLIVHGTYCKVFKENTLLLKYLKQYNVSVD